MQKQLNFFEEEKRTTTILLSLREEYFNQMLDGKKKYEYRTRYLKEETLAYIYISKTLKKVIAKIEFGVPIIGTANDIAVVAEREHPGCYQEMMNYMYNNVGYAIPVKKIIPIEEVSLKELQNNFLNFVPPQSYYILDRKPELLEFLNKRSEKNGRRR
mgnify:CR=1 FL=1